MSIYNNNEKKLVLVLNKKIELPKLINAIGHISCGITSLLDDQNELKFLNYKDSTGTEHPAISTYPYIVLESKNSNQIRTLRKLAIDNSIYYNDFVDTMLGSSAENQLSNTLDKEETELEYFAILLFAEASVLNPLTKKFSLFKSKLI